MCPLMLHLSAHKPPILNLKRHVSDIEFELPWINPTNRNDRTAGSHMPRMNWGTSAIPAVQLTTPEFAAQELLCLCHLIGRLKIAVISILLIVVASHGFLEIAYQQEMPM
jgi:hypothetical protein